MVTAAVSARSLALRAAAAACAVASAALVVVGPGASPAEATAYRYWSYWTGSAAGWTFASQGAARIPADGSVDGWRFAVSPATGSSKPPRTAARFGSVCGSTDPVPGSKRVAVVVDYGTEDDAPAGDAPPTGPVAACVVVPVDANGYAVLAQATGLRVEGGLVCGISGYPRTGCGEPVSDATPTSSHRPSPTPTPSASPSDPVSVRPADDTGTGASQGTRAPGGSPHPSASGAPSTPREPTRSGTPVAASLPAPPDPSDGGSGGTPVGVVAAAVALAALAAGAVVLGRRRT